MRLQGYMTRNAKKLNPNLAQGASFVCWDATEAVPRTLIVERQLSCLRYFRIGSGTAV